MANFCSEEKDNNKSIVVSEHLLALNLQTLPFYYSVIDNFLPNSLFDRICNIYDSLSFKPTHTDLYKFLQTDELAEIPELDFFKSSLNEVFKDKCNTKDAFYNVFASFYRKDDFLMCHDDMIDNRLYAFTFYLEDFESGKLMIYENDCKTVHKAIDVRKNRLVIFEVNDYSFHEVGLCMKDGRKAFAGWINSPSRNNCPKPISKTLFLDNNIEFFDLGVDIENEDCVLLEFKDIKSKELGRSISGPFIDRRCIRIDLEIVYAPSFLSYELVHNEYLLVETDGYILCNDKINSITKDILDVFIFECKENVPDFLVYINESSDISFTIDALDKHMALIKRNDHAICINKLSSPVYFKHLIYKRINCRRPEV